MNSTEGVNSGSKDFPAPERVRPADRKQLAKSAEAYVEIENRLAAQREKPAAGSSFDSVFDQLRGRLPR